ncbi:hypothetical protein [Streptomyces sp. NPDC056188]|uniref:hypothetical protein n=1 Tax=Streptomyces sp. NPDC056188 TaxID=3345740 RepID=UPI0035DF4C3E
MTDANECWIYTGTITSQGYGQIGVEGKVRQAYKVAYELFIGEVPPGLELDHLCHTRDLKCISNSDCRHRRCVNPWHLEPVTQRENTRRSNNPSAVNARKTHCIHGHEFSPENTYVKPNGQRQCRQCGRDASARYFASTGRARDRRARQRKQGDQS